ncbi:hypothetical protein B7P23_13780 [Corynebacterium glutamicum]|nr:hypothetical protein B7P23_13780 [Corynebacterium glutamicum]
MFLGLFVFEGVWWIHMVVCSLHPLFFVFVGVLGPLCTRHLRLGASVDKRTFPWFIGLVESLKMG